MRKVGPPLLNKWRPTAKSGCLVVVAFLGLLTACLVAAIWEMRTWPTPSNQTRMRVEPDMRACTLDASELPDGWRKDAAVSYPPYQKFLPTGALGSISIPFSHNRSNDAMSASHKIQLYRTPYQAAYRYKLRRIGYTSRWHRTWQPLDLTQANLSADEYRAACSDFVPDVGPGRGDKSCEVKARYGRFISVFDASVSPRDMSEEEMIRSLQAIDKHMLQCVDSFADKGWEEE